MKNKGLCPCGSGKSYKECCKPFHNKTKYPKTAEALMRARYSAYAKNQLTFLSETWHPTTHPHPLQLDTSLQWTSLEIFSTKDGTETDLLGTVSFKASYKKNGIADSITETSQFLRQSNRWFYLKGDMGT